MHSRIRLSAWVVLLLAGCGPSGETSDRVSFEQHEIEYRTDDDITIAATLGLPSRPPVAGGRGAPLVLLSHQLGRDRHSWSPLTVRLASAGYAYLALDVRSMGKSTREVASPAELTDAQKNSIRLDLLAGIDAAAREAGTRGGTVDTSRIAIVASGLSVPPAGQVAAERTSVRALVLVDGNLLPPEEFHLAAHPEIALLFAVADADERFTGAQRRQAAHLSGPNTQFYALGPASPGGPAAWKGTDGLTDDTGLADLIVWFLQRHVPPATPEDSQ